MPPQLLLTLAKPRSDPFTPYTQSLQMGATFDFLLLWASKDILNYILKHKQLTCTLPSTARYTSHVHASLHCQLGESRQYSQRKPQNWSSKKRVKQWLKRKGPEYRQRNWWAWGKTQQIREQRVYCASPARCRGERQTKRKDGLYIKMGKIRNHMHLFRTSLWKEAFL